MRMKFDQFRFAEPALSLIINRQKRRFRKPADFDEPALGRDGM